MKNRAIQGFISSVCFLALVVGLLVDLGSAQDRPNIILVMTDDQGWGDVEFAQQLSPNPTNPNDQTYAGHPELKTPQLSAMAAAGIQFNRFYSMAPVCSPTRASFLTGRHYRRTRVDSANIGNLLNRELTMAEVAKSIGYTTGHFGKWHLGVLDKSVRQIDSNRGGIERLPGAATNYSAPWNDRYDFTFATESRTNTFNPTDLDGEQLGTTLGANLLDTHYWTGYEQSLELTDTSLDGDDSRIIMDRVVPFMQSAVANNEPFLATVWFHTPHLPYVVDQATLDEFYSPAEQAAMTTNERGYYSCLTAMDREMGRLRQTLQDLGIADNTILLFTSDNGPEDGVPFVNDLATGNLRGRKRFLFEGGVRVPGLLEWPSQIAAGSSTDAIAGVIDLLPTLMEVWGLEFPDDRPIDGESILPLLNGGAVSRETPMMFDWQSLRSIVNPDGRFKAISTNNGDVWQLYDLIADPRETTNLANAQPAVLNDLVAQWNQWRAEIDAQRSIESDYNDYIAQIDQASVDITSPPSLLPFDLQSSVPSVVLEQQFYSVDQQLNVNSSGVPGNYSGADSSIVVLDETVHSYLLHFAPPTAQEVQFSVTFDNDILGVFGSETLLEETDFFAFANPAFINDSTRGVDAGSSDGWTIEPDGRTITVTMASAANTLDEIRVITATEFAGPRSMEIPVFSVADARLVGFTTNSRDDNNGGGSFPNLIGVNTGGVENFALYEFDFEAMTGVTARGATITVFSDILMNANHGDANDSIVINELALTNTDYVTGGLIITGADNMTDDGSISFLSRVQYNDSPGPPSGVTEPWLNNDGQPVPNLLGAITPVASVAGYEEGDSPVLRFTIDQEQAQQWVDDGVVGLVVTADDNGDSRSRFEILPTVTIAFEVEMDVLLGDVNRDGVVNLLDVGPFVDLLTSGMFQIEADINGDGIVNLLDVGPFVDLLTGG